MTGTVITGMAVWDRFGYDYESNFDQLLAEKNPCPDRPMFRDLMGFGLADPPPDIEQSRQKNFTKLPSPRFNVVAAWVADRAVAQAGLIDDRSKLGAFATSIFGDVESQEKTFAAYSTGRTRTGPSDLFYTVNDTLVSTLSRIHQVGGISVSMAATCSGGLYAIDLATSLIQQGKLAQALILAQDICTHPYNAFRTHGVGAFSQTNTCRPFDRARDGMVFGDVSAALVLESQESARERGAIVLSKIAGIGSSTQHLHRTNPQGARYCYFDAFEKALHSANLQPEDIDWISGHVTGTVDGDMVENDVMGDLLPGRPITSFKAHIGHTMGACGIPELIYTVVSMNRNLVPHIGNFECSDLDSRLIMVRDTVPHKSDIVIKNSYGFTGRAASVILQKP